MPSRWIMRAAGSVATIVLLACSSDDRHDDGAPFTAEQCARYASCAGDNPCAEGGCLFVDNCPTAICIATDEACRLRCGSPMSCAILESFPAQLRCEKRF